MIYPGNLWEFPTLICAPEINQPTKNKMAATGFQIKLTIDNV